MSSRRRWKEGTKLLPSREGHCPLHVRLGQVLIFLPGLEVLGLSCFGLSVRCKQAVLGMKDRTFFFFFDTAITL